MSAVKQAAKDKMVRIQRMVDGKSTAGAPILTPETVTTCWASVEPLQGREYWNGQQTIAEQRFVIKFLYHCAVASLTPKHRVIWGSRTFDIQSVTNPKEANIELHLICEEIYG